jgi:hypothetical protein
MFEFMKIVALCIAAAIAYGIIHDQFTIRICLEYFTVAHPPIFAHLPTTLHAAAWGVFATWWVGMILGVLAGFASRAGGWPKWHAAQLLTPISYLLIVIAIGSALGGAIGYTLATFGIVTLLEPFASRVPLEKHESMIMCAAAHLGAYGLAAFGGLLLCGRVIYLRRKAVTSP